MSKEQDKQEKREAASLSESPIRSLAIFSSSLTLTKRDVPPHPQLTPIRLWTNWILALVDMTRKSVLVASSAPPPMAGPPRAATVMRGARLQSSRSKILS